ncbi:MAG TPA: hypothetical protein VL284_03475 [Thermoanaerobaculia bacterium]|nr:hypothetical protein [Thermoanaerobaculia bacterium]
MRMREGAQATLIAAGLSAALLCGCYGGQESHAAEEQVPKKNPITTDAAAPPEAAAVDAKNELKSISAAIPVYAGAKYRDDLTRRDSVMIKDQYGQNAQVITLATDDSFPQVYHYYTTYLAQFRAYDPQPPFPPQQNWRTLEVQLNEAMQEPFIPGDALKSGDKQVTLQVAETEAEPRTVIRYIITPANGPAAVGGSQAVAAK